MFTIKHKHATTHHYLVIISLNIFKHNIYYLLLDKTTGNYIVLDTKYHLLFEIFPFLSYDEKTFVIKSVGIINVWGGSVLFSVEKYKLFPRKKSILLFCKDVKPTKSTVTNRYTDYFNESARCVLGLYHFTLWVAQF